MRSEQVRRSQRQDCDISCQYHSVLDLVCSEIVGRHLSDRGFSNQSSYLASSSKEKSRSAFSSEYIDAGCGFSR